MVLSADPNEHNGEKSPRQRPSDGFQDPPLLADDHQRSRKKLFEFNFSDIPVADLVVKFPGFPVIGKGETHAVMTRTYNGPARLGKRRGPISGLSQASGLTQRSPEKRSKSLDL